MRLTQYGTVPLSTCLSRALIGLALLAATAPPVSADALRCGSRVVATGAPAAEVLGACGEPVYRDVWSYPQPVTGAAVSDDEEWYYNFGPNQLLRILRFRHGTLAALDADGYGYTEPPRRHCTPPDFLPHLSKFRLLLTCGEPATRESYGVLRPFRDRRTGRVHADQLEPVYHERWVYNPGANYLLQIVTLENGRISDVASGDRGTNP